MSRPRLIRTYALLALLLPLVMLLGACAAASPAMPAPAGGDRLGADTDPYARDTSGEPVADADAGLRDDALIVHTGRMRLEVAEIAPAVEAATQLVVDLGGYVAGSQAESTAVSESVMVTFRIPAARWTEALSGLRAQAQRVISELTEAEDVTADVIDLDARITNLRASEAALQEIMSRAGSIKDVLEVQRELTSVRGQIEQLTGKRDYLQRQAAHGTLVVSFVTPVVAAAVAQDEWEAGAEIDRAVADLIRIGQRLTSAAIYVGVVVLPVVLPLLIVGLLAFRLRRRFIPGTPPSGPTA